MSRTAGSIHIYTVADVTVAIIDDDLTLVSADNRQPESGVQLQVIWTHQKRVVTSIHSTGM